MAPPQIPPAPPYLIKNEQSLILLIIHVYMYVPLGLTWLKGRIWWQLFESKLPEVHLLQIKAEIHLQQIPIILY